MLRLSYFKKKDEKIKSTIEAQAFIKLVVLIAGCLCNNFVKISGIIIRTKALLLKSWAIFSLGMYMTESYLSNFNTVGMFQFYQRLLNQTGQKFVHRIMAHITQIVVARKEARSLFVSR